MRPLILGFRMKRLRPAFRLVALGLAFAAAIVVVQSGRALAESDAGAGGTDDAGVAPGVEAGSDATPDAGAERYIVSEGVVYDVQTKLQWQEQVTDDPLAWADARDYCEQLTFVGKGWRLPSVSELQTIVDETRADPSVDPMAFPNAPTDHFWTSSSVSRFSSYVWTVSFSYGVSTFFDVNDTLRVRCVR
jgi:hypothetical protein